MKCKLCYLLLILLFVGECLGSYSLYSCSSLSGRTMLSILKDSNGSSKAPYRVILIIDGHKLEYGSRFLYKSSKSRSGRIKSLKILDGNGNLSMDLNLKKSKDNKLKAILKKGYLDPREGTPFKKYSNRRANVDLTCKFYKR